MNFYDDIEKERDRIEACIKKYGWTSDHHLGWFSIAVNDVRAIPSFVQFEDGSGILFHAYPEEWQIWSNPLCDRKMEADRISELLKYGFEKGIRKIKCNYISDNVHPQLIKEGMFKVSNIDYSLDWPVLNMEKFDVSLPGGRFKELRNAHNKFKKEHRFEVVDCSDKYREELHRVVNDWKGAALKKEEESYIYDLWYHNVVDKNFLNFKTARALIVDGVLVGFNAGYDVPNHPGRFGGIIGIHDYSVKDMGIILWLEDLEWIKNDGYKELDMQGSDGDGLKLKLRFGSVIERRTDTFSITRKV